MKIRLGVLIVFAAAGLAAQVLAQDTGVRCDACGVIQSIAEVPAGRQVWTPLGAVSPGTGVNGLGGMSGTSTQMSFGPGFSNQGLVVIGAAGGAAYAQKPNEYRRSAWEVTLTMDNGSTRVVRMRYEPLLVQEGDRVRVAGNNIELVQR